MLSRPKAVVVVGAGASHDVANEGVRGWDQRWKPPLAKDLFSGHLDHYAKILAQYPGALVLAQRLAPLGGRALESMLRDYAEHESEILRQYFKEIPLYLRDLLYQATHKYVRQPGNYTSMIVRMLEESPHDIAFIVLNTTTRCLSERSLSSTRRRTSSKDPKTGWTEAAKRWSSRFTARSTGFGRCLGNAERGVKPWTLSSRSGVQRRSGWRAWAFHQRSTPSTRR